MDRQITVSHVPLAEPHKLPLYATFLTGYRLRGFDLEVEIVLLLLDVQDLVLWKADDIVGQAGHVNSLCRYRHIGNCGSLAESISTNFR